ncbi:MAG TPA: GNAT family N-acetyltransferase [Myxococcota bacterium]|nr:GNAT family N-acetyltransferase [Myxococcota bacterium]HRY96001.1 GNAT family N-acetyltransferase [Myxococcota bacterium]HSA22474.1 GNAT family N-acetyltransferase [Myxococcota bacterium]
MHVIHHATVRELLGRTAPLAWRRPEEHKLPVDILEGVGELARVTHLRPVARLLEVARGQEPLGLALQTPPRNLVLGPMPEEAAACLAVELRARGAELPGVLGPVAAARAFAGAFRPPGGAPACERMAMRLYRCAAPRPPARPVPGRLRPGAWEEADLLTAWQAAFIRETGVSDDPAHAREAAEVHLHEGRMYVWEDERGVARACIAHGGRALGLARVYGVFTPPAARGRGLAAAMTAALTARLLEGHASAAVLFADLANPTSNGVYQRVGYTPVSDWLELSLGAG